MGASEEVILDAEERLGVRMPDELREFYREFGGVWDPVRDGDTGFSFPVNELLTILRTENCFLLSDREESPNPFGDDSTQPVDDPHLFVVVIDYMIASHYYAVRCVPTGSNAATGEVRLVAPGMLYPVAQSFDDFLRACLDDPDSVEVN
jgi:hypothetical protein